MIRSDVLLPPSSEAAALTRIISGIVAVSAAEARAIARSNPATFWNRLTARSTNSGRSQNVSVRTTRSRFMRRPPGSAGRHAVVSEDEDAVDDPHAQEEDGERPPWVGAADRQQRADRAQAAADDADDPAVGVAGQKREAAGELDHREHDQRPSERVEVGEDVPRVVGEDVRAVQRADAVDDVERSRDQQQNRRERRSTRTSHSVPPLVARWLKARDAPGQ